MPHMTPELVARCTGHTRRRKDETQEQFLRRLTHVYCSEKGVDKIGGLSRCYNLLALYLYDNAIVEIENLSSCNSLTHLYLQNNNIREMSNLSCLQKLTKLYLSGNKITVFEGLENLCNITEVHIANQRLPKGEKLLFDPRSLMAISGNLVVLNVSGNGLDNIEELTCLQELEYLSACDNDLYSMKSLSYVLRSLDKLTKLELLGNPFCKKHKYRDRVVTMGSSIRILDGRAVSDTERKFLISWKAMRRARRKCVKDSINYLPPIPSKTSNIPKKVLSKHLLLSMPALPPRQLPRFGYKQQQAPVSIQHPTALVTRINQGETDKSFKLPKIVSA